jgi:hypothetical protein
MPEVYEVPEVWMMDEVKGVDEATERWRRDEQKVWSWKA